jgi:hypothetical protein
MHRLVKLAIPILVSALLSACGSGIRTDRPLSLAETKQRKETDFPFPASATNIYYATYADFQAFEYLLRFDAPAPDCEATIARALAWHEARYRRSWTYPTVSVATEALPPSSYLEPVAWWDGSVVEQGLFAGKDLSHMPAIWVDSKLGRFYYRSTD